MTFDEIKKLIKQFDDSSLSELAYESEEASLTLKKSGDPHPVYTQPIMVHPQTVAQGMPVGGVHPGVAAAGAAGGDLSAPAAGSTATGNAAAGAPGTAAQAGGAVSGEEGDADVEVITSPIVGTFYRSPSPDSPPFCQEGDVVEKGKNICILEAMKVMNELEAEFSMEIVAFKVNNGDMVEYGTPIVEVRRV